MESQDNHHLSPEHASQESRPEHFEENALAAPAPAAIIKRLRLGRPSLLPEMDEVQLLAALESADWQVRVAAIRVLGMMGERVSMECLLAALQDSAWQVREMALLALGAREGHIPRATLMAALQDEDGSVRRAVHFLQEMYPDRFAETAAGLPANVSEESREPAFDPLLQAFLQRASSADQQEAYNGHITVPSDLGQTDLLFHTKHERDPERAEAQTLLEQEGKQEKRSNDLLPLHHDPALHHTAQHRSLQRYPRRGTLRVLRLTLLACWSIFLGHLVSIISNLLPLTHPNLHHLTAPLP